MGITADVGVLLRLGDAAEDDRLVCEPVSGESHGKETWMGKLKDNFLECL